MPAVQSSRKRSNPPGKKPMLGGKNMKIGLVVLVVIIIVAITGYAYITFAPEPEPAPSEENPIAVIETSMGTIRVELFKDKVPNTCENFIKLANDGFYDGLVFHRIINGFMIQGGGFYQNGTNKQSPYGSIDLEINPEVRHVDGAIAMARTNDPNSATSQFFINDGPQSQLEPGGVDPNGYAAFGAIKTDDAESFNVLRAIAAVQTETKYGMQDWPKVDVIITSITIEE